MNGPQNKHAFYRNWHRGEFGNTPRTWRSLRELEQSGYQGLLSVRSKTPSGRMETNVSVREAMGRRWQDEVFQEKMPDELLVIQGSLGYEPTGLSLEYCLEPNLNFREAMGRSTLAQGLQATFILKQLVDPPSLDDLYDLIQRYPNAIIEFATFHRNVGVCPHRRTVIFEVREY